MGAPARFAAVAAALLLLAALIEAAPGDRQSIEPIPIVATVTQPTTTTAQLPPMHHGHNCTHAMKTIRALGYRRQQLRQTTQRAKSLDTRFAHIMRLLQQRMAVSHVPTARP